MEFTLQTNEGEYDLTAHARLIGADILVAIWGGEKPHIGAVAAAQSRPSLNDPNVTSSTASVLCYLGHKEDALAKAAAEQLSAALDTKAVVTVGIHWDDLSKEGLRKINMNCEVLVKAVLRKIQSELGGES